MERRVFALVSWAIRQAERQGTCALLSADRVDVLPNPAQIDGLPEMTEPKSADGDRWEGSAEIGRTYACLFALPPNGCWRRASSLRWATLTATASAGRPADMVKSRRGKDPAWVNSAVQRVGPGQPVRARRLPAEPAACGLAWTPNHPVEIGRNSPLIQVCPRFRTERPHHSRR